MTAKVFFLSSLAKKPRNMKCEPLRQLTTDIAVVWENLLFRLPPFCLFWPWGKTLPASFFLTSIPLPAFNLHSSRFHLELEIPVFFLFLWQLSPPFPLSLAGLLRALWRRKENRRVLPRYRDLFPGVSADASSLSRFLALSIENFGLY